MKTEANAETDGEPLQTGAGTRLAQRSRQMPWADQMVPKKKEMVQ